MFHFGSLFCLPPSSECCRKPAWPRPLRGERPLGAAVSVPRGWRVFETQRWRAQSRRQKLRRRALKGAASEKGKSHAAAFSMPISPLPGRYYNRRARSFRGEPPPHAAQMVGRSRGPPRLVLRRFGRGLPRRPPPSAAVPLDCLRQPRKFTALGFSWAFFGANPPRKNAFSAFPKIPRPIKELP